MATNKITKQIPPWRKQIPWRKLQFTRTGERMPLAHGSRAHRVCLCELFDMPHEGLYHPYRIATHEGQHLVPRDVDWTGFRRKSHSGPRLAENDLSTVQFKLRINPRHLADLRAVAESQGLTPQACAIDMIRDGIIAAERATTAAPQKTRSKDAPKSRGQLLTKSEPTK